MYLRHRHLVTGLILGFLSLASYSLEASIATNFPLSVSHFFVLFAALAAGPEAALIAFSVGSFPSTFFDEGNFRYIFQGAVLTATVLASRKWLEEIPPYFSVLLVWLLVLIPSHIFFPWVHWHRSVHTHFLGLQALVDIFLVAFASMCTYIPWVYENILGKPYQPNQQRLFAAIAGTLFSLIALGGIFVTPFTEMINGVPITEGFDLRIVLTFAVLIVGLAAFGSRWIDATTLALSPHEKSRRLSGSFSTEELLPTSPKPPRDFELQNALRDLPSAIIVPPGVCALSSTGKVIFANHRFLELIQSAEGDLTGKSLFDCSMDNEIRASLQEYVKKSAEHGKISAEFKVNQLPERLRYFSVVIEPHHDEEQSPGRLLTVQEITDRRTIEFHLLEAQKMKNLGSVMGSIAHSFNNSLTAIIGRASFALRTRDQESQRIALEEIRGQAQKAGELVWKLLDFSEGKPTPFRSLSVGKLIHEKVEFLQKLLGERFQLKIAKEEESELWISGDSNLLMQVLTELISNAKDSYRDRGGNIELTVGSEEMGEDIAQLHPGALAGKYARITVRDTGCGMSSEMVSQAFAPLVSTKFNRGNSGLGLSIVYAILRAHDGFLSVESFPEKGTTVSVYLPLAEPVAEVLEPPPVEAMPAEKSTKQTQQKDASILVVEDEPEIRVLIGKMLEMLGYSVTTCGDAEAASTAFGEKAFDLLLVDYMMPSISGRDLIQDLKGKGSGKTKYILMSGFGLSNSDPNDPINHLPKPFDIETLDQAVAKALTN